MYNDRFPNKSEKNLYITSFYNKQETIIFNIVLSKINKYNYSIYDYSSR